MHTLHDRSPLQAEVLRGEHHFAALAAGWQAAVDRMARPSLFVTPAFLQVAWQHLAEPGDEPWFVVVRQDDRLVGLLPLVRRRAPASRLYRHVLVHMGLLCGDRPGLVHTVAADAVWAAAWRALQRLRRHWQALDLRELDAHAWPVRQAAALGRHLQLEPCTQAGALRIEGTWDDYLASRSRNTRQGFRRNERRLLEAHPDVRIDVADTPATVGAALDRYFAVDAKSWKRDACIEFWSDPRERDCLRALVTRLAASGQASVWLLAAGRADMAGLVRLRQGPVVYERCATYDPAYARFGPSTYLCMQAVRALFGSDCDESDVLGLPEPMAGRPAIHAWYPEVRQTWRLLQRNPPWWWRPFLVLRGKPAVAAPTLEAVVGHLVDGLPVPEPLPQASAEQLGRRARDQLALVPRAAELDL